MGQAPPLEELAARKRLARARMEIHRAEIALYFRHAMSPVRVAEAGWRTLTANPWLRWSAAAGAVALAVSGRLRRLGKIAGWIVPFALPRARGFLARKAGGLLWRGLLALVRRRA